VGASRNGSVKSPPEGEQGTSFAWGYEGVHSTDFLDKRRKPSPTDLDHMISVDGWALAMYAALVWPIRSLRWSVVPAEHDAGEAELCRAQLEPLMRRIVAGMCEAIGHGISFAELVWGSSVDGNLFLKDVAFRPVWSCIPKLNRNGRLVGFRQVAYGVVGGLVDEEFLVEERKAFVYAHDSTLAPNAGKSAFETAYQYFTDKRKVLFYRFKNLEKFGGPSTHGKTKATGKKREAFETAVRDARNGAAIITDPEDEISYLQVPNAGLAFRQAITDLNFEMAVSAQVQHLAYAQEGNSGSYNASEVQQRLLRKITEGRIAEMEAVAGELCRHISEVNLGLGAAIPSIQADAAAGEIRELIKEAAKMLFGNRPIPEWFAEEITLGYARQMHIEKPEGVEAMEGSQRAGEAGEDE
jgi:hypothetical protein